MTKRAVLWSSTAASWTGARRVEVRRAGVFGTKLGVYTDGKRIASFRNPYEAALLTDRLICNLCALGYVNRATCTH
jgi:hypothetical protein